MRFYRPSAGRSASLSSLSRKFSVPLTDTIEEMLRRFVTLARGLRPLRTGRNHARDLIAPAPGAETRGANVRVFEQHGDLVTDTVEQGRHLADALVDFLTTRLSSAGDA